MKLIGKAIKKVVLITSLLLIVTKAYALDPSCASFAGQWAGKWQVIPQTGKPQTYALRASHLRDDDRVIMNLSIDGGFEVNLWGSCSSGKINVSGVRKSGSIGNAFSTIRLEGIIIGNEIALSGFVRNSRNESDALDISLTKQ